MPPTATKPAGRRCGCSTWGLLALALLPLVSQDQFTALPSPKRYDNRYEQEFLKNIRPHQLPTRTWWWARGWGRGGNWYPLCNEYLLREQAHNA